MQNVVDISSVNQKKINWDTLAIVVVFHIFTGISFFYFSWANLLSAAGMYWIAGSLGVGLGYHRLLTHRGFQAPKWLEYALATLGTLAIQSGPVKWVATHRLHHAFTEQPKDPHSTRDGVFWAHIGWILQGTSQEHSQAVLDKYVPDLLKESYYIWLQRFYFVPLVIVAAIFYYFGGFGMMLWAAFGSVTFGWHFTWFVNSINHKWGSRRFDTLDDSTNNAFVAALTWGEGWHNNHHANPVSAKHGLAWYEIDINWMQIWALEKIGLAKNVKVYKPKGSKAEIKAAA